MAACFGIYHLGASEQPPDAQPSIMGVRTHCVLMRWVEQMRVQLPAEQNMNMNMNPPN